MFSIVMGLHTQEQRTWIGNRRRKERTNPELLVGGTSFLSQLAKARARQETTFMRRRVEQAWRMRWGAILACATARAVATSLLSLGTARMVTHVGGGREP